MKAIITNVKKSSGYSKYNGLTFEVKEVLSSIIALQIPSQLDINRFDTIDFSFKEVEIVDLQTEYQKAFDNFNSGSDYKTYENLKSLIHQRQLNITEPTYTCPS